MKKLNVSLLIAFVLFLTSCSNKDVDYNNKLVEYQKSVLQPYEMLTKSMDNADTSNMEPILKQADSVQKLVEGKVAEINKLSIPSGGEKLHKSFLDQFNFILEGIKNLKIIYDKSKNITEIQTAASWIMDSEKLGAKLSQELVAEQQAFAKAKNFKIQ